MKPIKKELKKYETIRITPEAKKALIALALKETQKEGRLVSLVEMGSKAILKYSNE
jgi:hypothetical protein